MALAKHAEEISYKVSENLQKLAEKHGGDNKYYSCKFAKQNVKKQRHPGVYPW